MYTRLLAALLCLITTVSTYAGTSPGTLVAEKSSAHTAEKETLKVGYFDLPPHSNDGTSDAPGAAMEYFNKVAEVMGVKVEYIRLPLSRLTFMLEHNRLDAALILAKSDARSNIFVYPASPILITKPVFVVKKDSNLQNWADIQKQHHLKIGVWQGGYHSAKLAANKNVLIPLSGNDVAHRGIELLINNRFDAFFSPDSHAVKFEALKHGQLDSIRILPIDDETIPLYTVFTQKTASVHLQAYEQALKKVKAELTYDSILQHYLQQYFENPL